MEDYGMNGYPNKESIEALRREYQLGTVVILDKMIDEQAPVVGSMGEVESIDDIGTIFVRWQNGSGLGVALGEDKIHKADEHESTLYKIGKESLKQQADPDGLHFCPRCGEEMGSIHRHAVSRNADIIVCDACGQAEAIESLVKAGLADGEVLPIEEWACVRGGYHIYAEEDADGWKITIPETGAEGHCEQLSDIIPTGIDLKG